MTTTRIVELVVVVLFAVCYWRMVRQEMRGNGVFRFKEDDE